MEICAPGAAIYTVNAGGGYVFEWGTSFSTPYVVGVAALAEAASGSSDGKVLKDFICNSDNLKKISGLEKYCQSSKSCFGLSFDRRDKRHGFAGSK